MLVRQATRFELPSGRDRILIRNGCYDHGTADERLIYAKLKRSINTINIFNIMFSSLSSNKFGESPDLNLGRPKRQIVAIFQWVGPGKLYSWMIILVV